MNNEQQGSDGPEGPVVGSVGEEAAKLFGALSGWAREQAGNPPAEADTTGDPGPTAAAGAAAHGLADALGDILGNVNEHIATGGADCRFCPVCQVIHVVRETNPEVKQQLTVAASSLLHAAAALLAGQAPRPGPPGVEKIDLSDDAAWGDER